MAVHALYFWPSLGASFKEIARVLKPGGRLALVFRSASDERSVAAFPADVYRFPTTEEVEALLQMAGMTVESLQVDAKITKARPVLAMATRSALPT